LWVSRAPERNFANRNIDITGTEFGCAHDNCSRGWDRRGQHYAAGRTLKPTGSEPRSGRSARAMSCRPWLAGAPNHNANVWSRQSFFVAQPWETSSSDCLLAGSWSAMGCNREPRVTQRHGAQPVGERQSRRCFRRTLARSPSWRRSDVWFHKCSDAVRRKAMRFDVSAAAAVFVAQGRST
jgi:hypothetical protein